jgi:diguanylate cyclase (GGDEF)-like protein
MPNYWYLHCPSSAEDGFFFSRRSVLSLRLRTFLVIAATLLALFVCLYAASSAIFMKGFYKLEQQEVQRQIVRGRETVSSLLAELAKHARDWANWDDTYAYMEDGNQEYIRSNLPATTFSQLDFDLFLYFGRNGDLFSGFLHENHKVVTPSESIISSFAQRRKLVRVPEDLSQVTEVILVDGRPMLVASAPILTSDGEGPSRGTLLIGRYLTEKRLHAAAKSAGLILSLVNPAESPIGLDLDHTELVKVAGENAIIGFFLLVDGGGKSVATIRVDGSRWIFLQGRAGQRYLLINLVAAGVVFVIVVLLLVNRLILARLAAMDSDVARIRKSNDLTVRLPVQGKDELDGLAITINQTLDELLKTQEIFRHDALHDPLTGLGNRTLLFKRIDECLKSLTVRTGSSFALLLIDMDHFKLVNDSFGHLAGDQLLILAARRLEKFFREKDTIARLGGDEFSVLLDPVEDAKEALTFAKGLLAQFKDPLVWDHHRLHISASVGIAMGLKNYTEPEQLLRDADTAMYQAKRGGRNGVALFDANMRERVVERLGLYNNLRDAAERGELCVHYQPLFELATGRLHGFEALVRWDHPDWGMLTPDRFIPLAESGGFMGEIDIWVFHEVCRCISHWQDCYGIGQSLVVSVNLSCVHSQLLDIFPTLGQILVMTGVDGRCVGLEITESVLSVAKSDFIESLSEIRKQGVRLYLDDFGTGHSSLNRLYQLPVDILKIDRSFITDLDAGKSKIAGAVIKMAHGLGMKVVAEGIEYKQQETQLLEHGCDYGQGYLYSKPLPEENATRLLQDYLGMDRGDKA